MPQPRIITGDTEADVVGLYEAGYGCDEIARRLSCSRTAIDNALARLGVKRRPKKEQQRINLILNEGSLADRVRSVVRENEAGCWDFIGPLQENGYAKVTVMGRSWWLHRLAWFAWFGPPPKGHEVCHRCDNRRCANPMHLFSGTRLDNMQDAKYKGRLSTGAAHGLRVKVGWAKKRAQLREERP